MARPTTGKCKKCDGPLVAYRCKPCRNKLATARRRHRRNTTELGSRDNQASLRSYRKHRVKRLNAMKARGPDYKRNSILKSTYGITLEQYEALLRRQKGLCLICKRPERRKNRFRGVCRLHVDHDHKTGRVRGLLCVTCNFALGGFGDSVVILKRAINYLSKQ